MSEENYFTKGQRAEIVDGFWGGHKDVFTVIFPKNCLTSSRIHSTASVSI